ncbi:alpha/beta hydrolase [Herbaspirillum sp. NPDC087042]|uniref:alpha/beta hydrolase n=1 Tax=Herbaspirillum sp. NPDC087042 TaxID=3364004 RepID=UPI003818308A
MRGAKLQRRRLLVAAMLAGLPALASAQPDLSQPLGPGIAERGSAWYRFERLDLRSADGRRGYRVMVGIPRQAAPVAGYPAIVLLDGNAALAAIDEAQLQDLQAGTPPVIVAIGYDTTLRFDVTARAYDYTPPIPAGQVDEETLRGRQGGGADGFAALIEERILPQVRARVALDDTRLAVWGHSYGGLFVLHTLFTRPGLFSRYIAASPSLWWQQGVILDEERRFTGAPGAQLWVMVGEAEQRQRRNTNAAGAGDAGTQSALAARAALPPQALPELLARLRTQHGLPVQWRSFPGMAHGPMLPASLAPALRIAAGLPPWLQP